MLKQRDKAVRVEARRVDVQLNWWIVDEIREHAEGALIVPTLRQLVAFTARWSATSSRGCRFSRQAE